MVFRLPWRAGLLSLAAAIAWVPTSVGAQTCLGTAPFGEGVGRIGLVAAHNENSRSIGASVAAGVVSGLFASASFSRLWIDAAEDPMPAFAATGGYSFDIEWREIFSFQVCPFAAYESVKGPEVDLGGGIPIVYVNSHAYRGGFALGGAVLRRPSYSIVPTGSLSYVREIATMRQGGSIDELSEEYGLLDGGVAVVFRRVFSVQALVSVPLGIPKLPLTYGLSFGMNFGTPEY